MSSSGPEQTRVTKCLHVFQPSQFCRLEATVILKYIYGDGTYQNIELVMVTFQAKDPTQVYFKLPKQRTEPDEMFIRIPKFAVEILSANAFEDNGREKPTFLTTQSQNTLGDPGERLDDHGQAQLRPKLSQQQM